jgi:hypothetical protein
MIVNRIAATARTLLWKVPALAQMFDQQPFQKRSDSPVIVCCRLLSGCFHDRFNPHANRSRTHHVCTPLSMIADLPLTSSGVNRIN